MVRPVTSKADFVNRYAKGEFGNRPLTWLTPHEMYNWGKDIHLNLPPGTRYNLRSRLPGGPCLYNLRWVDVFIHWHAPGVNQADFYVSMMCPHEGTILQGEVMRCPGGPYLYYSTSVLPMRQALAQSGRSARGIMALELLRSALCGNSYEWLNYLLDNYEDHVVEFTTLATNFGTLPNFNTLFWEVRAY